VLKEAHVKENPVPERCRPWNMVLERDTETDIVNITVKGNSGGEKAVFGVSYPELKESIRQLE
jgi:hypothetical protein